MKNYLVFVVLLLCAATVFAQDAGQAVLDYGTRVNIEPGFETSLDLSYRENPNTYGGMMAQNAVPCLYSLWEPSGERIFFVDHHNIFSVPVTGGQPRLEFESNCLYPYNGRQYILDQAIYSLMGFSSDGGKLYFTSAMVGEGSGAQVTINEVFDQDGEVTGFSANVTSSASIVKCLDLQTGIAEVIALNAWGLTVSRSGKYLSYYDNAAKTIRVKDMESGGERKINFSTIVAASFSDDEQMLLLANRPGSEGSVQFFKAPVQGGEPQQLSSPLRVPGEIHFLDCAPGGERVIYTYYTGENYTYGYGSIDSARRLCISDLKTGETADFVPFSKSIATDWARISPDGKQICYIHNNHDSLNDNWGLYIKNVSLPDKQLSVADAAPVSFALTGNHPNPFNPSTAISFSLEKAGTVELAIYDITGRKVRDLANGHMAPGRHEAVWNGRDDRGMPAASGVYFARLVSGGTTLSHRMLLMK